MTMNSFTERLTEFIHWRFSKNLGGFVFGLFYGAVLHFLVFEDLGFDEEFTLILTLSVCLLLAIINMFSTYIRCSCLLTLPRFCGKTGRGLLKTMAIAIVISGPFANIMINVKEVVRVFGCTSQLTYNLTMAKYNLMVEPFQESLLGLRYDARPIAETIESVEDVVEPLIMEVEGQDEVENLKAQNDYIDEVEGDSLRSNEIEKKYKYLQNRKRNLGNTSDEDAEFFEMEYKRKVEYRCEGVVSVGASRCRDLFQGAYDKCYKAVSPVAAWLICWPMKLTFICNFVSVFGGSSVCNADQAVEPGFGQNYATLKKGNKLLSANMGDVKIKYIFRGNIPKVNAKDVAESSHIAMQQFKHTKMYYDIVIILIQRAIAIIIILTIYSAATYQDKYLTDLHFDNNFITQYFIKIDQRREKQGHRYLLPLKKVEKKHLVDPRSILPTKKERAGMIKLSLLLLFEMFPATSFFMVDYVLHEILDIISQHSEVEFTQKGTHDIKVNVTGAGVVANLIRSLVKGFNVKRDVHVVHSNKTCLPKPTSLPLYFIVKTYGIYFTVWLMIIFSSYASRLNRAICALHYRKREKERVLFLYNNTLRKRVIFYRNILKTVEERAHEAELNFENNFFLSLRLTRPESYGWLRFFSVAKLKCLVCGDLEPWDKEKFIDCSSVDCGATYCIPCWMDLQRVCHVCYDSEKEEETSIFMENYIPPGNPS